ncbi:hypothetical protein NUW54_g11714 [Trametes sanguinea]|uniref:Uncharacterized protein n=1 Tax=Trametes sanguinea TaxID=158606 RepID=A0ACC1N9U6_9APHY|nr:hypothetical protein NUW54_g11714 [Trametes sanguinea]
MQTHTSTASLGTHADDTGGNEGTSSTTFGFRSGLPFPRRNQVDSARRPRAWDVPAGQVLVYADGSP